MKMGLGIVLALACFGLFANGCNSESTDVDGGVNLSDPKEASVLTDSAPTEDSEPTPDSEAPAEDQAVQLSKVEKMCTGLCTYCDRCQTVTCQFEWSPGEACITECIEDDTQSEMFKEEVIDYYVDCFADLECTQPIDYCVGQASKNFHPGGKNDEPVKSCLAKQEECLASFSDDYCFNFPLLEENLLLAAQECLEKDCQDATDCIKSVMSP